MIVVQPPLGFHGSEFPSGTVKVHGVVVTPRVVADPPLVDFGSADGGTD